MTNVTVVMPAYYSKLKVARLVPPSSFPDCFVAFELTRLTFSMALELA